MKNLLLSLAIGIMNNMLCSYSSSSASPIPVVRNPFLVSYYQLHPLLLEGLSVPDLRRSPHLFRSERQLPWPHSWFLPSSRHRCSGVQ